MRERLDGLLQVVTEHNLLVILLMLVLTGAVAAGVGQLKMESESSNSDAVSDNAVAQKQAYIAEHYANRSDGSDATTPAVVYVRAENGSALSKSSLLTSLRYQRDVLDNESVATALADEGGVRGVSTLVATRIAGSPDATLDEQITALEGASEATVRSTVVSVLSEGSPALRLMPNDYEPGAADADSRRMIFRLETGPDGSEAQGTDTAATKAMHDATAERTSPEHFTLGEHASDAAQRQYMQNTMELIVPVSLLVILAVLAFAYRDLVDVVVGFTGVVLSLLWMFGILGWLGVPAGTTLIIGPVLVVGLSVDYGLHVFMRYREQRGEGEGIAGPMHRGLRGVSVALALVTVTTAVGFLANLTSDWATVRELAVGITLGVASALVICVTLVPALKVTIDGLLERIGLDRRKHPLGKTGRIEPVLSAGARIARRAAPVVLVFAFVVGAAGAVAWTDLDRQGFQSDQDGIAEWKQTLPGPLGWDTHELYEQRDYVEQRYRSPDRDDRRRSQLLVEGSVTDPATLERLREARDEIAGSDIAFERQGSVPTVGPLSAMQQAAADSEELAATLERADTDGDGVPDRNLDGVYDAFYAAAPDLASQVVERTDGEYRSVRLVVPITSGANYETTTNVMTAAAESIESGTATAADSVESGDLTATAVGQATLSNAISKQAADNILRTLLVALGAVLVMLTVVYRIAEGEATLGAVTVLPIALVTTTVIGGMWVFDIPLTFLTALLLSLVVGLGIDYSIHVSDRFAQELDDRSVAGALHESVTGTGGALLGSTLTSVGAFSALLLHPHPQLQSFGTLVVLALSASFVVSVFVLPSVLVVWARLFHEEGDAPIDPAGGVAVSQD